MKRLREVLSFWTWPFTRTSELSRPKCLLLSRRNSTISRNDKSWYWGEVPRTGKDNPLIVTLILVLRNLAPPSRLPFDQSKRSSLFFFFFLVTCRKYEGSTQPTSESMDNCIVDISVRLLCVSVEKDRQWIVRSQRNGSVPYFCTKIRLILCFPWTFFFQS